MGEKFKDNRKIIYYTLVCIIIVIAVISGTYAYFTAKTTVDDVLTGETATITFGLSVTKVSNIDNEKGLIPMDDEFAPYAASNVCEDSSHNAVCQIYKITVTNTGTANMYLDGYITLKAVTEDEMRFLKLYYDGDEYCTSKNCQEPFQIDQVKTGIPLTQEDNYNRTDDYQALYVQDEYIKTQQQSDYYVMIWLHNLDKPQDELQGVNNFFNGSVTFISAEGNEVTAVFN